jgi:hypothetical protein
MKIPASRAEMDTRPRPDVPAADGPARPAADGERPLGELVRSLSRDAAHLVRQEIALARAEVRQNVRAAARDTVLIVMGGTIAALGGLVLLAALVIAVGDLLGDRYALGALLVGLVLLVIGGGVAFLGIRKARQARLAPQETLATLRETGEWARAEVAQVRIRAADGKSGRGMPDAATERSAAHHPPIHRDQPHEGEEDARGTPKEDQERAFRQTQPLPASAPLWKRVLHEFKADDVSNQAAKVAYYFFLSLPPAVMALFGLTGFFGGPRTGDWLTQRLTTSLPQEAS